MLKYKVGDRVKLCNRASWHYGRVGTVTEVLTGGRNYPYSVLLDATDKFPEHYCWASEDVLEPVVEATEGVTDAD